MDSGVPNLPLHSDIFVGPWVALKKELAGVSDNLIVYI